MAVFFIRTAAIAPGKAGEAMIFARDIAQVVKKITGVHVGVSTPHGGNPFRIRWHGSYDDFGHYGEKEKQLLSNPEYLAAVEKGAGLFIAGSAEDQLWRSVE